MPNLSSTFSIEQFAAYLDGNLPQDEMARWAQQAVHDQTLQQLLNASSVIDATIAGFSDLQLPPESVALSFSLPVVPTEGFAPLVALHPEPLVDDTMSIAACAASLEHTMDDSPEGCDSDQDYLAQPALKCDIPDHTAELPDVDFCE